MNKKAKVITAALATILMLGNGSIIYADPASEYIQNQEQQSQIQQAIHEAQTQIENMVDEQAVLQSKFEQLQAKVDVYATEMAELDLEILHLQDEIDGLQQTRDDRYNAYCTRIRAVEEYGISSYWSILFQATSIHDLLGRMDYVKEMMEADEAAIEMIDADVSKLHGQSDQLDEMKAERKYLASNLKMAQAELKKEIQFRIQEIKALETNKKQEYRT